VQINAPGAVRLRTPARLLRQQGGGPPTVTGDGAGSRPRRYPRGAGVPGRRGHVHAAWRVRRSWYRRGAGTAGVRRERTDAPRVHAGRGCASGAVLVCRVWPIWAIFTFRVLKVGRSVVTDAGSDVRQKSIVSAPVQMARVPGLYVIAEGVETDVQAEEMRRVERTWAQSFANRLIAAPGAGLSIAPRWFRCRRGGGLPRWRNASDLRLQHPLKAKGRAMLSVAVSGTAVPTGVRWPSSAGSPRFPR